MRAGMWHKHTDGSQEFYSDVPGLTLESKSLSLPLPLCWGGRDQWGLTNPVTLSVSPALRTGLPCLLI